MLIFYSQGIRYKEEVVLFKGFCFPILDIQDNNCHQSWWKGWNSGPVRSTWELWGSLVVRKGAWRAPPVTGPVGMVLSCARGLDWILESISLPREWSGIGTDFLEGWSLPQACQCFKGISTMPLTMFCSNLVSLESHRIFLLGPFLLKQSILSPVRAFLLLGFFFNTIHEPGKVWKWVLFTPALWSLTIYNLVTQHTEHAFNNWL